MSTTSLVLQKELMEDAIPSTHTYAVLLASIKERIQGAQVRAATMLVLQIEARLYHRQGKGRRIFKGLCYRPNPISPIKYKKIPTTSIF